MTAFILVTCMSLNEDPQDTAVQLLARISTQLNGLSINGSAIVPVLPARPSFIATPSDVRVNALWFASLICSLATASLGMLVKQWLREYLAGDFVSPHARLRIRHFRRASLKKWKVFEIAGVLPLLLQTSLGLFFAGLCLWTMSLNRTIGKTSIPLVCAWAVVLLLTTIAPVVSPRCPYKTTLLKGFFKWVRVQVVNRARSSSSSTKTLIVVPFVTSKPSLKPASIAPPVAAIASEEEVAVLDERADLDVLLDSDAVLSDDQLLGTTIRESLRQMECEGSDVVKFIYRILEHRLQTRMEGARFPLDLRQLTKHGWIAVSSILADALTSEMDKGDRPERHRSLVLLTWMQTALRILCSRSSHAIPKCSTDILVRCMLSEQQRSSPPRFAILSAWSVSQEDLAVFLRTCHDCARLGEGFGLVVCITQVLRAYNSDSDSANMILLDLRHVLTAANLPVPLLNQLTEMLVDLFYKEVFRERDVVDFWASSRGGQADEALDAVIWAYQHAAHDNKSGDIDVDTDSVSASIFIDDLTQLFAILIPHPKFCVHMLGAIVKQDADSIKFVSQSVARALVKVGYRLSKYLQVYPRS